MRKLLSLRRGTVITGLAGAAVVAAVVGPATMASAATPGVLTLCSQGGYDSHATFPSRGGFSTFVIPAGTCHATDLGGTQNEQVDVYQDGQNGPHYIASTIFNGSVGLTVVTTPGPSFYAYTP